MTVTVANTANTNTFDYWRNRTNELAYAMSTYAVTAGGSNTAADRKSTRLNSSHSQQSRMPSSA